MTPQRLRVMFSTGALDSKANPYLHQLIAELSMSAHVEMFSWRRLFLRRVDVLHVHWPESLVRAESRLKRLAKLSLGFAYLAQPARLRVPIVWTVHNPDPHEGGDGLERAFLRMFSTRVQQRIFVNESSENDLQPGDVTILHGSYREWHSIDEAIDERNGAPLVTYFGLVRPYKGVDTLVSAFRGMRRREDFRLRIMGSAHGQYEDVLRRAVATVPEAALELRHVDDAELISALRATTLVVLPYRKLYNSGSVLLALSVGVPVLVPSTPSTIALTAEFGDEWVRTYDGDLVSDELYRALIAAQGHSRTRLPDMSKRAWSDAGIAHVEAYRAAIRSAKRRLPERVPHSPVQGVRDSVQQAGGR